MDIFNNARNQFKDVRSKLLGPIEVPEWGTKEEPAKIYVKYLNMSEEAQRNQALKESFDEYVLTTLIIAAVDENQKKIFSETCKKQMSNEMDPTLLVRISNQINKLIDGVHQNDLEDEKKD